MSAIATTRRLIEAYAGSEPWKVQHDRAMACRDIEEALGWGIRLYRGLCEQEATLQARAIAGQPGEADSDTREFEQVFREWVATAQMILSAAATLAEEGFQMDSLEEFRQVTEEARCQVELWEFAPELLPVEAARPDLRPENPRPERYGL